MNKLPVYFFTGIVAIVSVHTTKADVLFSTNFNGYADGNLVGQDNWAAHSGAGNKPVQVSGGAITLQQSSGSGEDVNHDLGATMGAGDNWFYSFDVTVNGSSAENYFAMFLQGTGNFEGKLFVEPFTGSDFTFGISGSASTVAAGASTWATGLNFGTDYKVVVGFDYDSEVATLWVDPTSESSPSISNTGSFQDAATAIAFRQSSPTSDNSQTIDNLIVGTSFSDVVPAAAPEPSTLALAALGGVTCLFGFRRRR